MSATRIDFLEALLADRLDEARDLRAALVEIRNVLGPEPCPCDAHADCGLRAEAVEVLRIASAALRASETAPAPDAHRSSPESRSGARPRLGNGQRWRRRWRLMPRGHAKRTKEGNEFDVHAAARLTDDGYHCVLAHMSKGPVDVITHLCPKGKR